MLLSILIPTYNYDPSPLLEDLAGQVVPDGWDVEILVGDDGSSPPIWLNPATLARIVHPGKNLGRAGIRNLLALRGGGEYLLFIDSDSRISSTDFISFYCSYYLKCDAIAGGTYYDKKYNTGETEKLRWIYGKAKEQRTPEQRNMNPFAGIALNNLFISRKAWFQVGGLDESLKGYGHEDTLLGEALQRAGLKIHHIDNPVAHVGLESDDIFKAKSQESAAVLAGLIAKGKIKPESTSLSRVGEKLYSIGIGDLFTNLKIHKWPFFSRIARLQLLKLDAYLTERLKK